MENEGSYSQSSDNWNIAPGYVNLEILIPIINFGKYRRIARFGTEQQDGMQLPYYLKVTTRLEAIDRMIEELDSIISNCLFACKKDKPSLRKKRDTLEEIRLYVPAVASQSEDQTQRRVNLDINEEFFNLVFNMLLNLKEDVVEIANKNNLIFPQSDVITKEDIFNKVINRG